MGCSLPAFVRWRGEYLQAGSAGALGQAAQVAARFRYGQILLRFSSACLNVTGLLIFVGF